ncbi:MAG: hypothetical protein AABX52_00755 [Nanoarchaeota archaeon]
MEISYGARIIILALIVIATFSARVHFAYKNPDFVDEYSYFYARQAENFHQYGTLLLDDSITKDKEFMYFPPAFVYIISALSYLFSLEIIGKIILNAVAVSSVILIYLISEHITHHNIVSLTAAAIGGFVPSYFALTFGSLSPYSIVVPLILVIWYTFLNLSSQYSIPIYLTAIILLGFLHPSIIIVALTLVIYIILMRLEQIQIPNEEVEITLFTLFFVLWSQFLLYKQALLLHGISTIWQNIPPQLLQTYFSEFTIIDALIAVGTFPLAFGMFTIIKYLHNIKNAPINLIIAFGLSAGLLTYYRLLEPIIGFALLGISFVLLFAPAFKLTLTYIPQTKAAPYYIPVTILLILTILIFAIIPAYNYAQKTINTSIVTDDLPSLIWMRYNIPPDAVIASTPKEGNLIRSISRKQTILDTNFLLLTNAKERYNDLVTIFTSPVSTTAIATMEKLGSNYVFVSNTARNHFRITEPPFSTSPCFKTTTIGTTTVYQRICNVHTN